MPFPTKSRSPQRLVAWIAANAWLIEKLDLRMGQLISNAVTEAKASLFYAENEDLVEILDRHLKAYSGRGK